MDCKFRFARSGEIPEIIELMRPYNMHHVPSPEMGELDAKYFIVAVENGQLIGAAGFSFLSSDTGKTTLMAVKPDFAGQGIGKELQLRNPFIW